jgi:hypothetical protein
MTADLEEVEATNLEANPEEIESESEHQEVPKEEATVETIGALEDQYGDRHLAVGCCRQLKKRTQGGGGSRQKLAAAQGQLTCCAIPAPHKGYGHQGPGKDDDVHGTPKGHLFEKRCRA